METETTKPRLTLAREDCFNRCRLGDTYPLDIIAQAAQMAGFDYLAWRGNVYRVALDGVAGAIDPPKLIGTVGEILGEADNDHDQH